MRRFRLGGPAARVGTFESLGRSTPAASTGPPTYPLNPDSPRMRPAPAPRRASSPASRSGHRPRWVTLRTNSSMRWVENPPSAPPCPARRGARPPAAPGDGPSFRRRRDLCAKRRDGSLPQPSGRLPEGLGAKPMSDGPHCVLGPGLPEAEVRDSTTGRRMRSRWIRPGRSATLPRGDEGGLRSLAWAAARPSS